MSVIESGHITWGRPAQISDSKESLTCGACGAKRGIYGKHFGRGPDDNLVPIIDELAFDFTKDAKGHIAALCWNCGWSF